MPRGMQQVNPFVVATSWPRQDRRHRHGSQYVTANHTMSALYPLFILGGSGGTSPSHFRHPRPAAFFCRGRAKLRLSRRGFQADDQVAQPLPLDLSAAMWRACAPRLVADNQTPKGRMSFKVERAGTGNQRNFRLNHGRMVKCVSITSYCGDSVLGKSRCRRRGRHSSRRTFISGRGHHGTVLGPLQDCHGLAPRNVGNHTGTNPANRRLPGSRARSSLERDYRRKRAHRPAHSGTS